MTVGSQVKSCFSTIKSAEASLSLLAKKTQQDQSRQAFTQSAQLISEIKEDLKKQVIQLAKEEPQYK
ncbi:hypothetical protein JOC34_001134 [Virgibacillus halotolerans]|uniref:DUF1657 domain-containing protein n=1 Tax=Virgibacillus halotolerans TaxID=1071053 RepID=UPI0019607C69|nr:DUF1657 domain-containing protein [Virgibacillus halotolerans]MBM7598777.1 hypothetical protein [Virgibacillus halotolerans]